MGRRLGSKNKVYDGDGEEVLVDPSWSATVIAGVAVSKASSSTGGRLRGLRGLQPGQGRVGPARPERAPGDRTALVVGVERLGPGDGPVHVHLTSGNVLQNAVVGRGLTSHVMMLRKTIY